MPSHFLDYLKSRAEKVQAEYSQISERQRKAISMSYNENEQRAVNSELFEATIADIEMFGKEKALRYS